MPPQKRPRIDQAPKLAEEQNSQLNKIRQCLDTQLKAEQLLEVSQDAAIRTAMEEAISKGEKHLIEVTDQYLQTPFANSRQVMQLSDNQRSILRVLKQALINEINDPSEVNKAHLQAANKVLVDKFSVSESDAKEEWEPQHA